jgi:hypothetical protein
VVDDKFDDESNVLSDLYAGCVSDCLGGNRDKNCDR